MNSLFFIILYSEVLENVKISPKLIFFFATKIVKKNHEDNFFKTRIFFFATKIVKKNHEDNDY